MFRIRRSTDVVIVGCSKIESGDPLIYLETTIEVDSEHLTSFGAVDKKGNKEMVVVGRRRGAYRISVTQDELTRSKMFGALDEDVREDATKRIRNMYKWNSKYFAAVAPSADADPLPATPVVAADDDVRERDPAYCEKRFRQNEGHLLELLVEAGFNQDAVSDPCSGIFELLDLLDEKDVVLESEAELRDVLSRTPIEDVIGGVGGGIPNISEMIAAVNGHRTADEDIVDQAKTAA